jgi:hypothetical protein
VDELSGKNDDNNNDVDDELQQSTPVASDDAINQLGIFHRLPFQLIVFKHF